MLAHTIRGEGPETVLLLHGFLGSGRNLGALVRAWSERQPNLRFVQADLLGHGKSPPLPTRADLYTLGEAALELAEHLDIPRPFRVVGHSLGGRVALTMRDKAPDVVGQVTLLDIAPGPTRGLPSGEIAKVLVQAQDHAISRDTFAAQFRARGLSKGLIDWLLMNLERDDDGFHWRIDRAALVEFHTRTGAHDLWPVAEEHAPAIICLRGTESAYVQDKDVARYEWLQIPVLEVPGAGHFLHVDATDVVADYLAA